MVSAAEDAPIATGSRDVLRNRNFTIYLVAAIVSNAGSFMQGLSVAFVLHQITRSNTWVGVGAFAWMIPSLLMGPISGVVADRFDRRHVLMWSNVAQFLAAMGLWSLAVTGNLRPWPIVGLVTIGGLAAGFQYTAAQSLTAVLLPRHQMLQGIRMNSMGFTVARAIGPAFAGIVLDRWGASTAFALNAVSFLVFLCALSVVRTRPVTAMEFTGSWLDRTREGVRYVRERPMLRIVVFTAFVCAFFGQSMLQLAAGLAEEVFGVGGDGLGLLVAVYGVGSTIASILLVLGADRLARSRITVAGILLFGSGLAIVVATGRFAFGLVGFLVAGVAHSFTNVSLNTAVQSQVHEEYRGRVLSLFLMALLAGMPLGAVAGGVLGDAIGLRTTLGGFATMMLAYLVFVVVRRNGLSIVDGDEPVAGVTQRARTRPHLEESIPEAGV